MTLPRSYGGLRNAGILRNARYDGIPRSEANYRAFGYEPDFHRLPWKESYNS
jgi:hypothetical protein